MANKFTVGALEVCDLPQLEISKLHVRVDTGAQTSSLHVDNIEEFKKSDSLWVSFDIHPDVHNVNTVVRRQAKVHDIRVVKSSSGNKESRHVIETQIILGEQAWPIHITLTDRSSMTYLMLLGRQAMQDRILVDPSIEYILGQ
ncbi:RimK/LysX family protein [Oceaniserpentilla sp. 4NH20-0058]|uniref:ATP-dependent zinc protease family protein n=1 Tax=Oceaniserpentilla sp. 4NH20-0058 TaxID=3127660 RepID=UPI00310C49EF